jgi:hypothetical protein
MDLKKQPLQSFATFTYEILAEKLSNVVVDRCRSVEGGIFRTSPSTQQIFDEATFFRRASLLLRSSGQCSHYEDDDVSKSFYLYAFTCPCRENVHTKKIDK